MRQRLAILFSVAVLLLSIIVPVFTSFGESNALADSSTITDINQLKNYDFSFQDAANIVASPKASDSGPKITFTNQDIYDGNSSTWFLPGDNSSSNTVNYDGLCPYSSDSGINISRSTSSAGGPTAGIPQNKGVVSGTLKIGVLVGQNCHQHSITIPINTSTGSLASFIWDSENLNTISGTQYPSTFNPIQGTNGLIYTADNFNACGTGVFSGGNGTAVIVLDSTPSSSNSTDNRGAWFCEKTDGSQSNGTSWENNQLSKFLPNGDSAQYQFALTVGGKYNTSSNPGGGPGGSNGNTSVPSLSCSAGLNPLNWLICGIVSGLVGIIGDVDNLITGLLSVGSGNGSSEPSAIFCSKNTQSQDVTACNDYYSAWSQFRNIALGLLVLIGLVIIITEALGIEVLDAYTLRKVLPRLVFATIVIALSWQLMKFFVELTNAIGFGIRYLIYQPFVGLQDHADLAGGGGFAIDLATGAAITAMGIFGLLSFVATAAVAVFVAFLVLVIRQLVIIMLIILAPIAILAYILPNTQNLYKIWWDSFSKALLMFPLIAALIAVGRVFAAVTLTQDNSSAISNIIAFAAYFAPYFALPFTFRFAGGALSTIGGAVHNAHRGAYGAVSQFRKGQVARNMQALRSGTRWNEDHIAAPLTRRLNNFTRGAANIGEAGTDPRRMRSRMQAAISTQEYTRAKEDLEKNAAVQAITSNDDYNNAVMHSLTTDGNVNDARVREHLASLRDANGNQVYTGQALEQGVAAVRQARHSTSAEALAIATTIANAGTGTGYGGGAGEMYDAINTVAGGDRHLATRMLADARGLAERSRRPDLSGNGFGDSTGLMTQMYNGGQAGGMTVAEASRTAANNALTTQGVSAIMNARGNAVNNLTPLLRSRVDNAQRDFAAAVTAHGANSIEALTARDNRDRQLATIAGLYDASAYAPPEVSEALATVMGAGVAGGGDNGGPATIRQMIEDARERPAGPNGGQTFLELRREISSRAAMAANNAQGMNLPGGTPGAIPPPPPQP